MNQLPKTTHTDTGICFILNFAPHYRSEIYLLLEEELNARFYFANETLAKNLRKMDYTSFGRYPKELKFKKLFGNFNWISGSIGLVFKSHFKKFIITGEPFCISSWFVMIFAKFLGKEVYTWTHGWNGGEMGIKKMVKKTYFKLAAGLFLYGDYPKQLLVKEGIAPGKLFVVYNSLHYKRHLEIRTGLKKSDLYVQIFGNDYPVIIFVGRLLVQKKLDMLIEVQAMCLQKFDLQFNIVFIGKGPAVDSLNTLIGKYNLQKSNHFIGECYDEHLLGSYIFNADVCVSPGEIGLTAIHSLSYGTPVITHDHFVEQGPEFESISEGVNGAFFKQNSISDLAQVLTYWLKKYPHKSPAVIQECYRVVDEKYNPQFQLEVMKGVLNN